MEQLNQIMLRGNTGSNIYLNNVGDRRVIHFSVATTIAYTASDGSSLIDTCWLNVTAWEKEGMPDFELIQKGVGVEVTGRIRNYKYTAADGSEKNTIEVIANALTLIKEPLSPQL